MSPLGLEKARHARASFQSPCLNSLTSGARIIPGPGTKASPFSLLKQRSPCDRSGEESKASLPSCPLGLSLLRTGAFPVAPPQLLPGRGTEEPRLCGLEEAPRVRVRAQGPSPPCRAPGHRSSHSLYLLTRSLPILSLAEGKMQGPALQGPKKQLMDEALGKESQLQEARTGGGCLQGVEELRSPR